MLTAAAVILGYAAFICLFPGFFGDDFYLFSLISEHPGRLISTDTHDYFYLFFRPAAYFSHWLDVNVLGLPPWLMKSISGLCMSAAGWLFFLTIREIGVYSGFRFDTFTASSVTLFVVFHAAMVTGVIWLANRNQVLMSLFYISSLYLFFSYLNKRKYYFLILLFVSFVLSLLSKQFSVHLPLILICLMFLKTNKKIKTDKLLLFVLLCMLLFSLGFLAVVSRTQNIDYSFMIAGLWKKPFFYFNALIYTFLPFAGDYVYIWGVNHKIPVLFISLVLFIVMVYLLLRRKIKIGRNAALIIAVFVLSGFPALLLSFEARFLSPQVILSGLLLLSISSSIGNKTAVNIILTAVMVLNLAFSSYLAYDFRMQQKDYQREIQTLGETMKLSGRSKVILLCNNAVSQMYSYQRYFENRGTFGMDSAIICSPVICYPLGSYSYGKYPETGSLNVTRSGDTITVALNSEMFYLDIAGNEINRSEILNLRVLNYEYGNNKNYDLIKFRLPPGFKDEGALLVYHNGKNWVSLN